MARTSLAERMSRLEQQRAKLAEQEAKLRADERKQRTRRLIEAGTLVERAGLLDLEEATLYGALLSLAEPASNKTKFAEWAKAGNAALDGEKKAGDTAKEPLTVTFPSSLPTDYSTCLRAAGLRWNKLLQHWEGFVDHDAVAKLAAEHEGSVTRLRSVDGPEKDGHGKKSPGGKQSAEPSRS